MTTALLKPKKLTPAPEPDRRVSSNITFPESLVKRMATYVYEKHAGRSHIRNKLIIAWIDKALREEGY